VAGIAVSAGTTNNIYNNLIGELTAPSEVIHHRCNTRHKVLLQTTTTSSINVINNTIRLSGAGGAAFSSSCIFHTASTTATTATLNLRIYIDQSCYSSTGIATALRRSVLLYLGNYGAASNKNLLYAGANSIMHDGTTAFTLSTYKTAVNPRDLASCTGEAAFDYSATSGPTQFLRV